MSRFSLLRSGRQAPASGKARSDYLDDDFVADAPAGRGGRQKEAPDPALPEKKRARRRLVGAITLTLMAVIILPLVFDPEPKPVSQDVAIDVSARSKPATAVAAEPAPAQQKAQQPAEQAQQPSAAPVAAAAAIAGTAAVATAAKPAAKPTEAAAPAPKAETKPAASEQGKMIIQVAALATQQKAADLQAKLKSAGISSHTQKVDTQGGQRIRVRVGPLASKKDVDAVCAKLEKMKLQCTLVPA